MGGLRNNVNCNTQFFKVSGILEILLFFPFGFPFGASFLASFLDAVIEAKFVAALGVHPFVVFRKHILQVLLPVLFGDAGEPRPFQDTVVATRHALGVQREAE